MTSYTIDWLTCTLPDAVGPASLHAILDRVWHEQGAISQKPAFGYQWAIQSPCGVLVQSSGRLDMGTCIVHSGSALTELKMRTPDFDERLTKLLATCATCSRIDIAIDVTSIRLVKDLIACIKDDKVKTHVKKWGVIEGNDGGTTLYVGSRDSERMLRIYDKAVEQGLTGQTWDRIELEVKGQAAHRLARALAHFDPEGVVRSWIDDFCHFDNEIWTMLMTTPISYYSASQRRKSDTREWLLNSVSQIIAKRVMAGDTDLMSDLTHVVNHLCGFDKT
jgi:hypothetical protein